MNFLRSPGGKFTDAGRETPEQLVTAISARCTPHCTTYSPMLLSSQRWTHATNAHGNTNWIGYHRASHTGSRGACNILLIIIFCFFSPVFRTPVFIPPVLGVWGAEIRNRQGIRQHGIYYSRVLNASMCTVWYSARHKAWQRLGRSPLWKLAGLLCLLSFPV